MKTKILSTLILLWFQVSFTQWTNLNSGINDELTGVVFFGDSGIVSGKNGLYYTLNGGEGSSNWQRFEILDNSQNSTLYNNTEFTACYSNPENTENSYKVYAVGQDKINKVAVLMSIEFPSMVYEIVNLNEIIDSRIEDVKYSTQRKKYYAVGNNSLLIYFTDSVLEYSKIEVNNNYGNFTSLNFDRYSYSPIIGSQEKYLDFNTSRLTFDVFETPGISHKDIIYHPDNPNFIYSVSNEYLAYGRSIMYPRNSYFYGPLNGNEIFKYGTSERLFVGTDHGIYISNKGGKILQWQPSSSNYFINDFWNTNETQVLYACGKDGLIIKNELPLEEIEPYAKIQFNGGCFTEGVSHRISIIKGDTQNCEWYINNELVYNSCDKSSIYYKFANPGEYEIKLILDYNGTIKEIVKNIHIVITPEINKTISISDDILCKIETTEIFIENSEPKVQYILKNKETNETFGTSPVGNGGTISFRTSPIDFTGEFYFTAKNVFANCSKDFTNSFTITVEETKAEFATSLINAKQNEPVVFYEHTTDALNFNWAFSPNSNLSSSNQANPEISFSSLGPTEVFLETWSNNDCYDEITKSGPNIYQDLGHTENSWSILNGGEDPNWEGVSFDDLGNISPLQDGFLICGYNSNSTLNSKIGVSHTFQDFAGGYAAKYDSNGVLKWVVYTKHSIYARARDRNEIHFSVEDNEGNIYITGDSKTSFFDSTGSEIKIDTDHVSVNENFIIKLDSSGKVIWVMQLKKVFLKKLFIDKKNNLIATGYFGFRSKNDIYLNGNLSDTIGNTVSELPNSFSHSGHLIVKFNPDGSVIWDTPIFIASSSTNDGIVDLDFDKFNNIYLTGAFQFRAEFYSSESNVNETMITNSSNDRELFLVKYDEEGQLQWKLKSRTYNSLNDNTKPYSMVTDDDGNCFISGTNDMNTYTPPSRDTIHTFENTDGTLTQARVGLFFVSKVDSNGICEWIRGAAKTYYGIGHSILKNGNEICVLGKISDRIEYTVEATFTSTNGDDITLSIDRPNYFIAIYDTNGNIKRIVQNGENDDIPIMQFFNGTTSFFKGLGNNYYMGFNFNSAYQISDYINFGHIIPSSNGWDGVVTRFTEDSGIIHYPKSLSTDDVSINLSNYKIHPNPTEDILYITSKSQISKLEIYNNIGQVVLLELNKASIDISSLNTGLYFIKIKDEIGNSEIKKFIKE